MASRWIGYRNNNQPSLLNVMRRIHGGKAQIVLVFSGRETDGIRMNGKDANQ